MLNRAPCKGNSLIIRLLPLQGVGLMWRIFTQGVALGYVLLPLRGVLLVSFDPPTNKADGIHVLGWCTSWLVHLRQVHPLELMHCLFGRCTPCSGKRQSRAETSAPLKYHRKTTNISEIIRNFAASIVESKLLDFCNTEAS